MVWFWSQLNSLRSGGGRRDDDDKSSHLSCGNIETITQNNGVMLGYHFSGSPEDVAAEKARYSGDKLPASGDGSPRPRSAYASSGPECIDEENDAGEIDADKKGFLIVVKILIIAAALGLVVFGPGVAAKRSSVSVEASDLDAQLNLAESMDAKSGKEPEMDSHPSAVGEDAEDDGIDAQLNLADSMDAKSGKEPEMDSYPSVVEEDAEDDGIVALNLADSMDAKSGKEPDMESYPSAIEEDAGDDRIDALESEIHALRSETAHLHSELALLRQEIHQLSQLLEGAAAAGTLDLSMTDDTFQAMSMPEYVTKSPATKSKSSKKSKSKGGAPAPATKGSSKSSPKSSSKKSGTKTMSTKKSSGGRLSPNACLIASAATIGLHQFY